MEVHRFPFPALVAQEAMQAALLLGAVDPTLGGVLIRGRKGTGKSTAVRGVAALLSPMPLVELPLGATEDRVVGSLHVEEALRSGERVFEGGLLLAADQGVLYVDEVNLLDDHLVDLLLDAAASGVNIVEREGISHAHPARFLLVGTMNPEEGELRPQFLDRFGLCVQVTTVLDPVARQAVVQRRLAFDRDPAAFCDAWRDAGAALADQVRQARAALPGVEVPDELLAAAVQLAAAVGADGHRAEITMGKAARARAALLGRTRAGREDLRDVAGLALWHRMASQPLETPEALQRRLEETVSRVLDGEAPPQEPDDAPEELPLEPAAASMQVPGSAAAGSRLLPALKKKLPIASSSPTG
jgi:Mg-chelatase subunit ChlI